MTAKAKVHRVTYDVVFYDKDGEASARYAVPGEQAPDGSWHPARRLVVAPENAVPVVTPVLHTRFAHFHHARRAWVLLRHPRLWLELWKDRHA